MGERLGDEFVLASQRSEALGGSVEEVEDPDGKECALPWQEFGSEKSEASKNYFAETKFEVNGEERCLSEVGPEDLLGMEEGDFDKYELTHVQIYAGYKKKIKKKKKKKNPPKKKKKKKKKKS